MEENKRSALLPLSEWAHLNEVDLRKEIIKKIMNGETAYAYFIDEYRQKIENSDIKNGVDKILLDLIDQVDSGVGEQALLVCVHLMLIGIKEKILAILPKIEALCGNIQKNPFVEKCGIQIQYLFEFNLAVRRLNLKEAKDFLVKQLGPVKGLSPQPGVTKEFYLYQLAQSALDALKKIDPELAKKHQ